MYVALLHTHNFTRWIVLLAALAAIVLALMGRFGKQPYGKHHRVANIAFVASMDLQLVLGLLLYFVSPLVRSGLTDIGAAMADAAIRFVVVEHALLMILAVALAHVGSVSVRKAATDAGRHGAALVFFGLALVLVLAAIPWDRALVPGG